MRFLQSDNLGSPIIHFELLRLSLLWFKRPGLFFLLLVMIISLHRRDLVVGKRGIMALTAPERRNTPLDIVYLERFGWNQHGRFNEL